MKKLLAVIASFTLTACSSPGLDVKSQWSDSIVNYAMVPLYPMREDVFVGDIRIHVVEVGGSSTLDSRYLGRLEDVDEGLIGKERRAPNYINAEFASGQGSQQPLDLPGASQPGKAQMPQAGSAASGEGKGQKNDGASVPDPELLIAGTQLPAERWPQPTVDLAAGRIDPNSGRLLYDRQVDRLRRAALPRLDAARITRAEAESMGIIGIFNFLVGGKVEDEETLMISLTKLETAELSDPDVIKVFHDQVKERLQNDDGFLMAVCHAALSWGDQAFDKTAISLVTRVFYARGIQYSYGDNFGAALQASIDPTGAKVRRLQKLGGGAEVGKAARLGLNEEFNVPMAFGVDAVMLDPRNLGIDLAGRCVDHQRKFRVSPVKLKNRAKGS